MESPDGGTRPSGATEMALLDRPHDRRAVSFGPTARRRHQWRARTAARSRPAQLNNTDGVVRRPAGGLVWPNGVPTWRRQHQCKSLDCPISFPRGAVTGCENVLSPMSRRRDARRSLRADRPRGESGGDGQAAAYPGRNIRSRRGACAGETRSEGAPARSFFPSRRAGVVFDGKV